MIAVKHPAIRGWRSIVAISTPGPIYQQSPSRAARDRRIGIGADP
jgi:hypothetical protein